MYVNNFGCLYHAGEEARCTCSFFAINEGEEAPHHPRVFWIEESQRFSYRGQNEAEQKKIEDRHDAANSASDEK